MARLPQLSAPVTLGDQAYAAIREAIVTGSLKRGEKVTERGLAELLTISATPVREALRRLEQDRLVERTGPRSVRIAQFGKEELREFTMIEDALRALAARLAAEKSTAAQRREMCACLDEADALRGELREVAPGTDRERDLVIGIQSLMRRFHSLVDEASGNATLMQMLRTVDAFGAAERHDSLLSEVRGEHRTIVDERYRQHRAIYDAIAAGNGERAEELMRAHSHSSNTSRIASRFPD
ncbi:DNA-binding GntR family transcriptional regulator [Thermocatellispora tengchongensis]|uniref:DNA-binding GntR family transcriptional regulator n=1 Tax=Thermocatellispora tengchongensis TaxID=1073253 RepID=A0A840P4K2_9ACTN|nr:GntR family transcriptional regulator [Thermocatellispora tengchongensis]MBB5132410.1 DNA-binding GntR family transcriptional regulator [Thermocatellispora tengchongensis]